MENEKKGEKLEKITWFLKGQGRIRIRIRIRKFITDPDPDPQGQKNTDPDGSGSETLVMTDPNYLLFTTIQKYIVSKSRETKKKGLSII